MTIQTDSYIPVVIENTRQNYSYTDTDTLKDLQRKIFDKSGIPIAEQSLRVCYGWKIWKRSEITDSKTPLINRLKTASKIDVYTKSRC